MKTSENGLNLIKKFEGFSAVAYRNPGDRWTIGYGHTRGVTGDTPPISLQKATDLLAFDVRASEWAVNTKITTALNQNQFDALVSLVFNVGTGPVNMTLGLLLNQGRYQDAADQFPLWCHATGPDGIKVRVKGLLIRREAERELFLS